MNLIHSSLLILLSLAAFFQTVSAAFNHTLAVEYTYVSTLAYCSPTHITQWQCGAACKHLTTYHPLFSKEFPVSSQESLAFSILVEHTDKKIVPAFRGSIGTYELLMEVLQRKGVKYELAELPDALVDEYFYTHYVKYLRGTFFTELKKAMTSYPEYKIVFTGHSLGAALATLAAFDAIKSNLVAKEKVFVYNFGMPRLGNYVFAKAVEKEIEEHYRVVHWKDLVPHVPFCHRKDGHCVPEKNEHGIPGGWPAWHTKPEIFYNHKNTEFVVCDGDGEDTKCSDRFPIIETDIVNHLYYFGVWMDCAQKMEEQEGFLSQISL